VKATSNPTNTMSVISPISVISVRVTQSVLATAPTTPAQMMTQESAAETGAPISNTMVEVLDSGNRAAEQTAANTAAQSTSASASVAAKSVEFMRKLEQKLPKQPILINPISLAQEIPDGIRRQQEFFSELIKPDDSWLDRDIPADYRRSGLYGD
jgi:hypothetical protein